MPNYTHILEKEPFDNKYSAASVIVTLVLGLALYNCLELTLLILTTFKRWKGLYFWSLSLCNAGVAGYGLGMLFDYFSLTILWVSKVFVTVGWTSMITCQSLVLYSRLGLILDNPKILRAVKWMIIFDSAILLNITTVLDWGCTYSKNPSFMTGYFFIELIQVTIITIQELIISSLYVWKTLALLKVISKEHTRSMVLQVLTINVMIIGMDIALIVLQYKHLQLYQESFKIFVYSVKLKLEMNILSKLVDLVHGSSANRSMTLEIIDSNAVPGQAQADVRREMSSNTGSNTGEHLNSWYGSDMKGALADMENGHAGKELSFRSSIPKSSSNETEITRVLSHPGSHTARTSARESDLYSEYLRSSK